MANRLKSFVKKHKNNILLRPALALRRNIIDRKVDKAARKRLEKVLSRSHDGREGRKIRVVFLVIDPNVWNKQEDLYLELEKRDEIELFMVCVPHYHYGDPRDTYEYFSKAGYDCIDAEPSKGEWFDLRSLEPDYIFYPVPYNFYFPEQYKTNVTSAYAKLCFTNYGIATSDEFLTMMDRAFFADLYLNYTNDREEMLYNVARHKSNHKKGLQFTKYLGYTGFSQMGKAQNENSGSWAFSKNDFRAMWTPRWTVEEELGGSNFFRYKNVLVDYAEAHSAVDFLFRPHPLTFSNFVKKGLMTEDDVTDFKNKCEDMPNISLDRQKEYAASFWNSDVLISDISSVCVEYFITGKPMIYCKTEKENLHHFNYFLRMLDCSYVVNNGEELLEALDMLVSGNDRKKEDRLSLINELYGADLYRASELIAEDVVNDFRSSNK